MRYGGATAGNGGGPTGRARAANGGASRRRLLAGLAAAPAGALALACGAPSSTSPPPATSAVPGKVLVISYQTSAPRLDRQIANYEEFNREFKPQGLEVEFANPGVAVIEKVTTLHVAGTPADMWEYHALWRDQEGMIARPASSASPTSQLRSRPAPVRTPRTSLSK